MPRFKKACERGYQGAIKLAAFCSGKTEAAIDNAYKKWAADGGGGAHDDDDIAQEELLEQGQEVSMAPENECEAVLTSVLQESGWVDPEGCEPEVPTADADAEAFSKVSMKAEVEQMLAGGGADDTSQKLPSSLLEIMNGTGESSTPCSVWSWSWGAAMAALMLGGWRTTGRAESPAEIWTGIST